MSLIFFREIYASVPMYAELTFAFIKLLASFNESPERFSLPISGRLIEPSLLIE
jgi:hypothetical protein